jgi:HPt (histidine-containing phosphotransfer) domain-containing protein
MIERLGGDEPLARQLVDLFLTEAPHLVARLRESFASGHAERVRRAAHAAKGCIANFVEGGADQTALQIERLGAEGRLAEAEALVARFEAELAELTAGMHAFKAGDRCVS